MEVLSTELFGHVMAAREFPRLKGVAGLGISDSADYASVLADRFEYRNTWYHRDPVFDITKIEDAERGRYDFVIASEVLEHVEPPVDRSFRNLFDLLKPEGVLILTVPFTLGERTAEHFPRLRDYGLARLSDGFVLVNRAEDGTLEVYEDLVFHGGPGSTLEMRVFCERELRQILLATGFDELQVYSAPADEWGIRHPEPWSLPMAARKSRFRLPRGAVSDWTEQWSKALAELRQERAKSVTPTRVTELEAELTARTQWAQRLDGELEQAAGRVTELEEELRARTQWAQDLQKQLDDRTAWALKLEQELGEHVAIAERLQKETDSMRQELNSARLQLQELQSSAAVRVSRKLGLR